MDMKELDRLLIHLHYVQRPPVSPLSAPDVSSTCMHESIGVNLQAHEQGFDDAATGCTKIVLTGGTISAVDGFGTKVRIACALQLGQ